MCLQASLLFQPCPALSGPNNSIPKFVSCKLCTKCISTTFFIFYIERDFNAITSFDFSFFYLNMVVVSLAYFLCSKEAWLLKIVMSCKFMYIFMMSEFFLQN